MLEKLNPLRQTYARESEPLASRNQAQAKDPYPHELQRTRLKGSLRPRKACPDWNGLYRYHGFWSDNHPEVWCKPDQNPWHRQIPPTNQSNARQNEERRICQLQKSFRPKMTCQRRSQIGANPRCRQNTKAVGDLSLIAFYFLLRVGEYTVKGTRNKLTQIEQFKIKDV